MCWFSDFFHRFFDDFSADFWFGLFVDCLVNAVLKNADTMSATRAICVAICLLSPVYLSFSLFLFFHFESCMTISFTFLILFHFPYFFYITPSALSSVYDNFLLPIPKPLDPKYSGSGSWLDPEIWEIWHLKEINKKRKEIAKTICKKNIFYGIDVQCDAIWWEQFENWTLFEGLLLLN